MKLGIAVVYLFSDERSERLLHVHLNQIEKHTTVPYVIYGSVNRLHPRFRKRLAQHPRVRMCELPPTAARGGEEHAYYLDHLVRIAAGEGATHIVSLHLDSFPVRSGWAEELAAKVSGSCVLATIERINTACLFFDRHFYLRYRPTFRLSETERADPLYRRYIKLHRPIEHSGIGYGFTAYSKGLSWYYLRQTHTDPQLHAKIYDGMIFHIGNAVFYSQESTPRRGFIHLPAYLRTINTVASAYRARLPLALRQVLRFFFSAPMGYLFDRPRVLARAREAERITERLSDDPEGFLSNLTKRPPQDQNPLETEPLKHTARNHPGRRRPL